MERDLRRLAGLVSETDVGVPTSAVVSDLLRAANMALSRSGSPRLRDLEDHPAIKRAIRALERSAG